MACRNRPSIIWDTMANNIARLRKVLKLTTYEVSRRAGFPRDYLERIEARVIQRSHFQTIEKIAIALQVEMDDIMDGTYYLPVPIYQRVRWLREKNNLSREEVSNLSGISLMALTDLENNKHKREFQIGLAYKLASALGVRTYDLVGENALTPPVVIRRKDPNPKESLKKILQKMRQTNQDFEQGNLNELQYYSRQAREVEQALDVVDKL